jgi:predicted alpha/beta hydrolase family esterase
MFPTIQRNLLYHPSPAEAGNWKYGVYQFIGQPKQDQNQFLLFHGNEGNAQGRLPVVGTYGLGHYYLNEYVGFGARYNETANKKDIILQAQKALEALDPTLPIYLIGESLGTGVVCEIARYCKVTISGIILITPYATMGEMANLMLPILGGLFLIDRYNCTHHLKALKKKSNVRVIVVAGLRDTMIPFSQAIKVQKAGKGELISFNGDHHQAYQLKGEWIERAMMLLGLEQVAMGEV